MARHHRPAALASLGDALDGGRLALGEAGEVASRESGLAGLETFLDLFNHH